MKNYWYEVFEVLPNNSGTQTLPNGQCETLKEARKLKKKFSGFCKELHIDKWQIVNSTPEPIAEIE